MLERLHLDVIGSCASYSVHCDDNMDGRGDGAVGLIAIVPCDSSRVVYCVRVCGITCRMSAASMLRVRIMHDMLVVKAWKQLYAPAI